MASVLNTNIASLSAQRFLSSAQNKLSVSFERLSSGSRINRAQDDAAGMGITQQLTASIAATSVSSRNANDAIGVIQTAEGALAEISTMLQRFKELATQGANDALSTTQRKFLSVEMGELRDEIEGIAERTTFNGTSLLKNTDNATLTFQTGADVDDTFTVNSVNILSNSTLFGSLQSILGSNNGSRCVG